LIFLCFLSAFSFAKQQKQRKIKLLRTFAFAAIAAFGPYEVTLALLVVVVVASPQPRNSLGSYRSKNKSPRWLLFFLVAKV
jgi:hypothetical protein